METGVEPRKSCQIVGPESTRQFSNSIRPVNQTSQWLGACMGWERPCRESMGFVAYPVCDQQQRVRLWDMQPALHVVDHVVHHVAGLVVTSGSSARPVAYHAYPRLRCAASREYMRAQRLLGPEDVRM